jgi:hypothetical protein
MKEEVGLAISQHAVIGEVWQGIDLRAALPVITATLWAGVLGTAIFFMFCRSV